MKQIVMAQIISTEAPSSFCWGFLFLAEHLYSREENMLFSTSGNMLKYEIKLFFNLWHCNLCTNVHKSLSCFDRIKHVKCFAKYQILHKIVKIHLYVKVEIFLEHREVAFLSPSKICKNLNFSTKIQIFANFAVWYRVVQIMYCPLKLKNWWQAQNFLII